MHSSPQSKSEILLRMGDGRQSMSLTLKTQRAANGGAIVFTRRRILVVAAGSVAAGAALGTGIAAQQAAPNGQDKLALADSDAKQMLLLMDKDKDGKVSKQEFMNFMEAEFERLDINKDGKLDVDELTRSQLKFRTGPSRPR